MMTYQGAADELTSYGIHAKANEPHSFLGTQMQTHAGDFSSAEQAKAQPTRPSSPATSPPPSATSRRRCLSVPPTTSSTQTDPPPTPVSASTSRPWPTPRKPFSSSLTGPRATSGSARLISAWATSTKL